MIGRRPPRRPSAFSLVEVLIVIGIIAGLFAIILAGAEKARHQAYITKCASNLHGIGLAITIYENDDRGAFPRTIYDPATADAPAKGTGVHAADPFSAGTTVQPNDVTAALFLLMRVEKLPPALFVCPYNDVTSFAPDSADLAGRSNFTDQRVNLAYSVADPYPNSAAVAAGYVLSNRLPAAFPLAADKNPGYGDANDDVFAATATSPAAVVRRANSPNHEQEGQNVLYADGHVTYERTPFVGPAGDNLYTAKGSVKPAVEVSPADATDAILLPTDD